MDQPAWLKRGILIARVERTRRRRQFNRSTTWRLAFLLGVVALSIAVTVTAYGIGQGVRQGTVTLPLDVIRAATTALAILPLVVITRRASVRFERVDFDHLLTTVPARDVVLGVAGFLYGQYAIPLALPVLGLAAGFALGAHAPLSALTIAVTLGALLALVVLASVTLSLTAEYLALRSPRFRRYRTIIVYGPLVLVMFVLTSPGVSIDRVVAWLQPVPLAWVADLALLGAPVIDSGVGRSVGAVCLLGGGVSVLTGTATALGERAWGADEVGSAAVHRSRSLVGGGLAEWLFAGRVSRPVLTVARKRWVQERRVPRAYMMIVALVLLSGNVVGIYALTTGTPAVTPLLIAFTCAAGVGLGFGDYILAAEYPSLPMTLTSVSGEAFVRGTMLAGLAVGVPVTVLLTVAVGIVSPIGLLELLVVTIAGVLLCGCSIAVATALGMRFVYTEFLLLPVKIPLSSVRRVFGRMGKAPFLNIGRAIGVVGLVSLPAFFSYLSVVSTPIATTLGVPPGIVRSGALVVTSLLAIGVSISAYRRAVTRFNEYQLP